MATTTINTDDEKFHSRLKTLIKLVRIAWRAAFHKSSSNCAYLVLEATQTGCCVERSGLATGNIYTLFYLAHLEREMALRIVRDHEGSSAALENARSIINSQN